MIEVQKYLEGQTVDDRYPLLELLGSTPNSSVFRTQCAEAPNRQAAVKLISAPAAASGARLTRWRLVARFSHPALLRVFDMGRCEIENRPMLYVVMELAEENLAEILRVRRLSPDEVSALLKPATEALAYLHTKGFVHGRLKPSNIFAIGDQVKLASDSVARIGEAADLRDPRDPFCAPEVSRSAASDVWSLGATVVECLAGRLPEANSETPSAITVPSSIPSPFLELARHCLNPLPQRRWTLSQIETVISRGAVSPSVEAAEAAPDAEPASVPAPESAFTKPKSVAPSPSRLRLRLRLSQKYRFALAAFAAGAAAFVLGVVISGSNSGSNSDPAATRSIPAVAPATIRNKAIVEPKSLTKSVAQALPEKRSGGQPVHAHSSDAAVVVTSAAPAAPAPVSAESAESGAPSASTAPTASTASTATTATPAAGNLIPGAVSRRAVPRVPESASDTIHGTVRVSVIVDVDPHGRVVEAKLDFPGPSRYFARLSMAAANDWKFAPPRVEGAIVPSEWVIDFGYTESGVSATAAERHP